MIKTAGIAVALSILSHVLFAQTNEGLTVELKNGVVFLNAMRLTQQLNIDDLKKLLGEPSKVYTETTTSLIDKTRLKRRIYKYDHPGIIIDVTVDDGKLFSLELSYSTVKSKSVTEHPFTGKFYVNGIEINQSDTQQQIQNKLPYFVLYDVMGALCTVSKDKERFVLTYNPWANGIQSVIIYFTPE